MSLAFNRRIRQLVMPLGALLCLSACASQDTTQTYDDVKESEAKEALTADFVVPYYDKATLFYVKRSVCAFPASVSVTGSFHTADDCPSASDNYSRRLRIDNWTVLDVEKADTKCTFKAKKDKMECLFTATNDGGQTTVLIESKSPK
jgi:hypothetical protein